MSLFQRGADLARWSGQSKLRKQNAGVQTVGRRLPANMRPAERPHVIGLRKLTVYPDLRPSGIEPFAYSMQRPVGQDFWCPYRSAFRIECRNRVTNFVCGE